MSDELPSLGETTRWNGGTWTVDALAEGTVELVNIETGEREKLNLAEWFGGVDSQCIKRRVRPPVLGTYRRPRKGAYMLWKGVTWKVTVIRSGIINLQNVDTDETGGIKVRDWQTACFEGTVEMLKAPGEGLDARTRETLAMPITNMPSSMRKPLEHATLFMEAWRNPQAFYAKHLPNVPEEERTRPPYLSRRYVEPFLVAVATAHGVARPGFSTWCKWLARINRANGDIRAIAPRHDLQGPQKRYMNPRLEQLLCEAISKFWLTRRKNQKNKVWEELSDQIAYWNAENPDRLLVCPSKGHVARYIREEIDRYVVASRRGTKEDADRSFRQVGRAAEPSTILERVEADHTFIDMRVKDDETGVVLGFPWFTAALDRYSRMPLAGHLNFENQSLGANLQCLKQVMSPKTFLPKLVPELDYDFPWGVPTTFFFDRGTDYDNDTMRRVGLSLDVMIDYEPVALPEFKGMIERFWRTLKEDVIYGLRGARVSRNGRPQSGVDDDGEPWITYSELLRRIWLWFSMVYPREYHRGINDIPLRRWQEAAAITMPRTPRKKDDLNILLTHVVECQLDVKGVTYDGLTWTDGAAGALRNIMQSPSYREKMQVEVRFDEYDVSKAWVIDPFTRRDEPLKPVLPRYMDGLSYHAHGVIRKNTGKPKLGTLDEQSLVDAKRKMRRQEASAYERADRTGKPVGNAIAKFGGKGQKAPFGDDLGDALPDPSTLPQEISLEDSEDDMVAVRDEPPTPARRVKAQRLRNDR